MALKRGTVMLEEHSEEWKELFNSEKELLQNVIGDLIPGEIEHVGSTSIPGLMAKPIIDILVVVYSLDDIDEIEKRLSNYGYFNRGKQGVEDRYFFAKGSEDARTHYVHFTEKNSHCYKDLIYFRNYMINNPEYIKKYQELKLELAEKFSDNRKMYTASKHEFILTVLNIARSEYDD